MDTTGLIFVVVIGIWVAYLIPQHLARRTVDVVEEGLDAATTPEPTITVHHGVPQPDGEDEAEPNGQLGAAGLLDLPVATDLTRRALRREIRLLARRAARARRRALVALAALALAAAVAGLAGLTSWWTLVAGLAALVAGLVLSRWNVVRVNRRLDRYRAAADRGGSEATVAIQPPQAEAAAAVASREVLVGPAGESQLSLWDPLPIPPPTYLSQPSAPRTTRTIDLASRAPAQPAPVVTADAPDQPDDGDTEYSAAV
ncbi:MAG: hypothetical protein LBI84_02735 [Propionibacteriaceae bacterium]|nr:hypothetical protein [Propionibacteriaceae bacterium]